MNYLDLLNIIKSNSELYKHYKGGDEIQRFVLYQSLEKEHELGEYLRPYKEFFEEGRFEKYEGS